MAVVATTLRATADRRQLKAMRRARPGRPVRTMAAVPFRRHKVVTVTSSALFLAPAVMTMRKNAPSMPPAKPMAAGHIADFMLANVMPIAVSMEIVAKIFTKSAREALEKRPITMATTVLAPLAPSLAVENSLLGSPASAMPDAITIPTVALTTMPPVAYPLGPWEDVVSLAASSTERPMTASATRTASSTTLAVQTMWLFAKHVI
mmetsp:Transcript_29188/g.63438  ORF Transcript_29188/g.63438 Transcript_29188/m.63438 type:complete len:206 (+) Transcript_29188:495-1112(+)